THPAWSMPPESSCRTDRLDICVKTAEPGLFSAPCKGAVLQRVRLPPGNWSFQPVAIGATEEVTSPSKPLVQRVAWGRLGECAGRNASERRAGLGTGDVGADPPECRGRPLSLDKTNDLRNQRSHRGKGEGMHTHGEPTQHGKPQRWQRVTVNRKPARDRPGRLG